MGKDKKKDDKEKSKFSDKEMVKKLNEFHLKASKKIKDPKMKETIQKRAENGDSILQKPQFKNNPLAVKERLLKNFPDMKKEMKFLDEWAKYLEKNPPEASTPPQTPKSSSPAPPPVAKSTETYADACDGFFAADPTLASLLRKLIVDYRECVGPDEESLVEAMPRKFKQVLEKGMVQEFHVRLMERYGTKANFQYLLDYQKDLDARQQQEEIIEQQQEQIDHQAQVLERVKSEIMAASQAASSQRQTPEMQAAVIATPQIAPPQAPPPPPPPLPGIQAVVSPPLTHVSNVSQGAPQTKAGGGQLQVPEQHPPAAASISSAAPSVVNGQGTPQLIHEQHNENIAGLHIPSVDKTQLNALIEAGWQPPVQMMQQQSQQQYTSGLRGLDASVGRNPNEIQGIGGSISPFLPGPINVRNRGVSGSPDSSLPISRRRYESDHRDDRSSAWSEGGSRSGRTTPFRNQLVQQIKELQEIHKELASHQRSQMDLLNKQQYINEQVYHPEEKPVLSSGIPQTGMRRFSANSNVTGGRLLPPPTPVGGGMPSALETLRQSSNQTNNSGSDDKRINHIEEELGRLRNVCSQLMGLVQQAYTVGAKTTPAMVPQSAEPQQQLQQPQSDQHLTHSQQDQPLWVQHHSNEDPVYNKDLKRSSQRHEKSKKSIFNFFNRSRKPKQSAKEPTDRYHSKRKSTRDEQIEVFRERVVHADNLIRQFRKITSSSSGHVRQEAAFVQQQLAALSQTLREEAKNLGLLPPSPPHAKSSYRQHQRYDDTTDYSSVGDTASAVESSVYTPSRTTATLSDASSSPQSYGRYVSLFF